MASKKGRVAHDGVADESFVRFRWCCAEVRAVFEIHFHGLNRACGSGDFAVDFEGNSFVRLDLNHEDIRIVFPFSMLEEDARWIFKRDGNFGRFFGKSFPRTDVKRGS